MTSLMWCGTIVFVLVSITKRTGIFQFVTIRAAKLAKGRPYRILITLNVVTAAFSMVLDTVTTVLILAPVALLLAEEMELDPRPFIITMAISANFGGTATMIGDPPNIMIGSNAHLSFIDFVNVNLPVVIFIMILYCGFLSIYFKNRMKITNETEARILDLDESKSITDVPLLIKSLVVLFLVIISLTLHRQLDLPPATIALAGGFLLVLLADHHRIDHFLQEIEWGTIFFFIGLFIMIQGLVELGVIKIIANGFLTLTAGNMMVTTLLMLWFAGILSAFIDNIPLGACIGGNGTLIGASANVVSAGLAKKSGFSISFMDFLVYGAPTILLALLICTGYLFLRFFL